MIFSLFELLSILIPMISNLKAKVEIDGVPFPHREDELASTENEISE